MISRAGRSLTEIVMRRETVSSTTRANPARAAMVVSNSAASALTAKTDRESAVPVTVNVPREGSAGAAGVVAVGVEVVAGEGVLPAFKAETFAGGTAGAVRLGKTDAAPEVFGPPSTEPVFPETNGDAGVATGAETEGAAGEEEAGTGAVGAEGVAGEAGACAVCAKARVTPRDAHKKSADEAC